MEHNKGKDFSQSSLLGASFWIHGGRISHNTTSSVILMAEDENDSPLISKEALKYVFTISFFVLCGSLSLFGIGTNIINMTVFIKMKFNDTINIAMLGLSISDLIAMVTSLWSCLLYNPWLLYADLPIQVMELQIPSSWAHVIFMRVSAFITAYITLERCLCIVFPLKVKQMLTPKRVKIIIVMIYILTFGFMSAYYASISKVGWKYDHGRNRTVFGITYNEHRVAIRSYNFAINSTCLLASFTAVIIFSCIIIWKLNQRGKWKDQVTTGGKKSTSSRDIQAIKMVVCVALVFICSLTPAVMFFITGAFVPDINVGEKYQNTFFTFSSIMANCDAINASVNIFIYYKMSSKYNQVYCSLFSRNDESLASPLGK